MADPIADAGSDQELTFNPGGYPSTALDGSASTPGDGSSIVTYTWTLMYKPPTSGATISGTGATPNLINIDLAGSYVVHLQVENDLSDVSKPSTPPDVYESTNSSFTTVAHKTKDRDWRIPGQWERGWTDILYDVWIQLDENLIGVWDETHVLSFTTGLDASVIDERVDTTKGGLTGLKLSTTTGVNSATHYTGVWSIPGKNTGAGKSYGLRSSDANYGIHTADTDERAWDHTASAGDKLISVDANARTVFELFDITMATNSRMTAVMRPTKIINPWGTDAANDLAEENIFHVDKLSVGQMIFDLDAAESYNSLQSSIDHGIIQVRTDQDGPTAEKTFYLARVVRMSSGKTLSGKDNGLYFEGNTTTLPGTWGMRDRNGVKANIPGMRRSLDEASDAVIDIFSPRQIVGRTRVTHTPATQVREINQTVTIFDEEFLNVTANADMAIQGRIVDASTKLKGWVPNWANGDLKVGFGAPSHSGGNTQVPVSIRFKDDVISHHAVIGLTSLTDNASKQSSARTFATDFGFNLWIRDNSLVDHWVDLDHRNASAAGDIIVFGWDSLTTSGGADNESVTGITVFHQRVQAARATDLDFGMTFNIKPLFFQDDWVDIEWFVTGQTKV